MTATRALVHPISLAAIALLVVNDHVLKQLAPGLVTGKLSDFAGLAFFPLLLAAAAEHAGIRRGTQTIVVAAIATGLAFAAVKLAAPAAELYRVGLAALQWPARALRAIVTGGALPALGRVRFVADPTDLVALVALAVPVALTRTQRRRSSRTRRVHALRAFDAPADAAVLHRHL
jgi:hypothetical protein